MVEIIPFPEPFCICEFGKSSDAPVRVFGATVRVLDAPLRAADATVRVVDAEARVADTLIQSEIIAALFAATRD